MEQYINKSALVAEIEKYISNYKGILNKVDKSSYETTDKVGKHEYVIVNKEGKDIFQLSREAERDGRTMAILPGESADLCRKDFVKFYRKFGRDKFLEILKSHQHTKDTELKKYMMDL